MREKLLSHEKAAFKAGDMIVAKNGRGDCYEVCWVEDLQWQVAYYLDNGAVHVAKRARSGYNGAERIDRYYRKAS